MTAAGDLESDEGWKPGSTQAVAAHVVVGAVTAALGGGNALQGAGSAAAGEAVTPYLARYGNDVLLAGTALVEHWSAVAPVHPRRWRTRNTTI